jgi:hypothetical protein
MSYVLTLTYDLRPHCCAAATPTGEVLSERLSVRPLASGWLRVLGVSWLLAGAAEGYAEFDIKGRRRKRPKGERYAHYYTYWVPTCSCITLVHCAALCLGRSALQTSSSAWMPMSI